MTQWTERLRWSRHMVSRAWRCFKKPKNWIAVIIFAVGVPGYLDDIAVWITWIKEAKKASLPVLAKIPIEPIVEFLSSDLSRWLALGLAIFIFEINRVTLVIKWFINRMGYIMAASLDTKHFISMDNAVGVIQRSEWASSRKRKTIKAKTAFQEMQSALFWTDPARQEREKMFRNWCGLVLDQFQQEMGDAVQPSDKGKEYDEVALKKWLTERYTLDLVGEFGEP